MQPHKGAEGCVCVPARTRACVYVHTKDAEKQQPQSFHMVLGNSPTAGTVLSKRQPGPLSLLLTPSHLQEQALYTISLTMTSRSLRTVFSALRMTALRSPTVAGGGGSLVQGPVVGC